jgi:hypothetical protein
MTGSETREHRADGLTVGSVGPFYVALNRAALYLVSGIFLTAAPLVIFVLRDASTPVRLVVSFGVSMDTGTLAQIVHLLVTIVLFGAIFALLFVA